MTIIQSGVFAGYRYQVNQINPNNYTVTINGSTIGFSSTLERAYDMVDKYYKAKNL